ncbi:hypothetical protein [Levilactobacillus sp. N40-8-2]|uniref:hypothetical protein n=1 Tax=Levilactobacillus muriae TaxID=3238987 RepID=UPI0038B350AF
MTIQRLKTNVTLYLGIFLAIIPILLHIINVVIPHFLFSDSTTINTTTITEWLGFSQSLKYTYIFYLSLPFFCSLSLNQCVWEDVQSGFLNRIVFYSSIKKYWSTTMLFSFTGGFFTVTLPLLLDLIATYAFLPLLRPDWMINSLLPSPQLTYFHTLYYENPLLLILIYIIIGGMLGGICTMLSSLTALFCKHRVVIISFPLIVCLGLAILTILFPKIFFDPTTIAIAYSPDYLPPFIKIIIFAVILPIVLYLIGIERIRRLVN